MIECTLDEHNSSHMTWGRWKSGIFPKVFCSHDILSFLLSTFSRFFPFCAYWSWVRLDDYTDNWRETSWFHESLVFLCIFDCANATVEFIPLCSRTFQKKFWKFAVENFLEYRCHDCSIIQAACATYWETVWIWGLCQIRERYNRVIFYTPNNLDNKTTLASCPRIPTKLLITCNTYRSAISNSLTQTITFQRYASGYSPHMSFTYSKPNRCWAFSINWLSNWSVIGIANNKYRVIVHRVWLVCKGFW